MKTVKLRNLRNCRNQLPSSIPYFLELKKIARIETNYKNCLYDNSAVYLFLVSCFLLFTSPWISSRWIYEPQNLTGSII